MTPMMPPLRFGSTLALTLFVSFSAFPADTPTALRVALYVGAGSITQRETLHQRLEGGGQIDVTLLDIGTLSGTEAGRIAAAAIPADLLLQVQRTGGSESTYISASLHDVTTGDFLGETAFVREKDAAAIDLLAAWFASMKEALRGRKPFDSNQFKRWLEGANRCDDVVTFLEGKEPFEQVFSKCAGSVSRERSATLQFQLRLRTVGAPEALQSAFSRALDDGELREQVREISRHSTDLVLRCSADCSAGVIQIMVPFDPALYRTGKPKRENLLEPFRPLAAALIRLQTKAASNAPSPYRNSVPHFARELILQDSEGHDHRITVSGSRSAPVLQADDDAQALLRSAL